MMPRWCLSLLVASLAVAYLSQETQGIAAVTLAKVIYHVYTIGGQVMSLTSWATGGCVYYPSICDLKDSIAEKEPVATELAESMTESSQALYTLYDENVDMWNMLNLANIRNERVIGQIEMLEDLSNDMINRLDLTTDVIVIAPEEIDNNPDVIDESIVLITAEIDELNQALESAKVSDGWKRNIGATGSAIYYGYLMYSYYKYVTHTPNVVHAGGLQRRNAVQVQTFSLDGFWVRMGHIQTYFSNRPQLVRVINAAYYGVSAFLTGLTLALDITNSKKLRNDLERIDSDLDYIIVNYTETATTLSTTLEEQRQINANMTQNYEDIKELFLESTKYLERLRLGTTATSDPALWTLPTYTTDNVNADNLLDSITEYNDWLIELKEEQIALDNRLQAISMVEDMVVLYSTFPVYLLEVVAQSFDNTMTRDAVLATIADKVPDASTWPDMAGPVQLEPYRGL